MKRRRILIFGAGVFLSVLDATSWGQESQATTTRNKPERAQVPTWSAADLEFFLHGSMSSEIVPEVVLRAFIRTYPDLFPNEDLSHLGLIPDPDFGWPVGFSRKVPHLGNLSSVGVNCAACHVTEVMKAGSNSVRTMHELLSSPSERATKFRRGSRVFDQPRMGYTDEGSYLLDTSLETRSGRSFR